MLSWGVAVGGRLDYCCGWYYGVLLCVVGWVAALDGTLPTLGCCSRWYYGLLLWVVDWALITQWLHLPSRALLMTAGPNCKALGTRVSVFLICPTSK